MKQSRNSIMRGMSGSLGEELVFRQRAGKTVVCLPPVPREDNPTEEQLTIRSKFHEASRYAKTAIANPTLKAQYKAKAELGTSAYNVAFADFFRAPVILNVDASNYSGAPGNTILIEAIDDFKVQSVRVTILTAGGDVLETGTAVANPESSGYWTYTITASNPDRSGVVRIQVSDLPGNVTTREVSL